MQLVLNELSSQFPLSNQYQAREEMTLFLKTYKAAVKVTGSDQLILDKDYNHINLAVGYCIKQWRNDSEVDIEDKRVFRSLIQRSALYDAFPIEDVSEFKVHPYGISSQGCLLAYLLSGCCLSFHRKEWDIPFINGDYYSIDKQTEQIINREVRIPNIASVSTATTFSQTYSDQIKRENCESFISGEDILKCRDKFSNIIFCKNTENQLLKERCRNSVVQIAKRLVELQEYFESAEGAFNPNQLNHCTTESETTLQTYKQDHTFILPNGKNQLFSWHLRFTGDYAGRIFFHPDMKSKKCYIGHIGHKLPTVENPT